MYKIGCLLSAVGTMAIANDGFVLYLGQNKRNTYPLEQREKKETNKRASQVHSATVVGTSLLSTEIPPKRGQ